MLSGVLFLRAGAREPYSGPTWAVTRQRLQLAIVERGTLESAENSDIVCRVKAKAQGSTVATTIKWVIDDGTQVKKGEKLIELDDSGLQDQLKTQINTVNKAKSDWIQAQENCLIVESQNFSDIETAKVAKTLAELDVRKYAGLNAGEKLLKFSKREELQHYLGGDFERDLRYELEQSPDKLTSEYLQKLNDIEGRIEVARSDREQSLDRASWSKRMVRKGYISRSQAESDQAKLESYQISLRKVQGELDIFRKFLRERELTDLWSKVKEADRALLRVQTQARSKRVQADADRESKQAIYLQEDTRRAEIEEEIRKCMIYSPQDGLVVYFVPEQSRFGSGSQQSIVAQGEPVREGQKLMRIPNLGKMLVNVRVHEAMISKVRGEVRRPTGFGEALWVAGGFGMPTDVRALAGYQLGFAELRPAFKDYDELVVDQGQRARVRVEAYPNKEPYKGHVKTVATVASQADWLSSDVKVYQTMVAIDGTVDRLRPGMSAEVTILAQEETEPVLTVPIQSVVGISASGPQRKVFVLDAEGIPQEREIEVGMSNAKLVAVLKGLSEGEKVVLNPRSLLSEKSNLKPGTPGTRRGAEFGDEGGGKKGGKKGFKGGRRPGGNSGPGGGFPGAPGGGTGGGKQFQRPPGGTTPPAATKQ